MDSALSGIFMEINQYLRTKNRYTMTLIIKVAIIVYCIIVFCFALKFMEEDFERDIVDFEIIDGVSVALLAIFWPVTLLLDLFFDD